MFISVFRLALVILSSMVAGMNIFNIMSARANGLSIQMPLFTFIGMLAIIAMMLTTQHMQNRKTAKNNEQQKQ